MTCPHCGAGDDDHLVPVWEDPDRYGEGEHPKFVGCTRCHKMHRPDLLRRPDGLGTPSQAKLSESERNRLASMDAVGNQNNTKLTIIEWQVVKGAASHYGVTDWTAKVDPTLSKAENVGLMRQRATKNGGTTLRERPSPGEYESVSD